LKIYALLFDPPESRQGKHLKSAGVRENGPVPGHKFMEPSELLDQLVARTHMKMIRVGQLHLCFYCLQTVCAHRSLDSTHRSHVYETRRLNGAVHCLKPASFCQAVSRQ